METFGELKSISKGALYSFLGKGTGFILDYLFILLLARFSGPAIVGLFFIAITVVNILSIFSRLGLAEGVLRFISIYNGSNEHAKAKGAFLFSTMLVLTLSTILSLLLFLNAHVFADLLNKPGLEILIKAFSLSLPFVALFKIFLSSFQAFHEIKYMALLEGFLLPASMMAMYLLLYSMGGKLTALGIAYTTSYLLVCFIAFRMLQKIFGGGRALMVIDYKTLFAFSFPLTFVGLLALTSGQIDTLVIGWVRTAREVGIFSVSFKLSLLCVAILASVNYIFSPIIANLHNQNEMEKLEKIFKVVTRWVFVLSLPIYFILVVNSESVLRIFGAKYVAGAVPLMILCTGQLINFSTGSVGIMVTMTGKSFITLMNSLVFILFNIVLDILLVPAYGITGAASGFAVSLAVVNLLKLIQVYYFLGIHPYSLRLFIPVSSAVLMFTLILLLNAIFPRGIINTLIYSFLGVVVYIVIMANTIHEEDKEILEYVVSGSIGKVKNLFNYNGGN